MPEEGNDFLKVGCPRAPLPQVNMLNNFTYSCVYEKVWEFLQTSKVPL
jgi:hypothetical protein